MRMTANWRQFLPSALPKLSFFWQGERFPRPKKSSARPIFSSALPEKSSALPEKSFPRPVFWQKQPVPSPC